MKKSFILTMAAGLAAALPAPEVEVPDFGVSDGTNGSTAPVVF